MKKRERLYKFVRWQIDQAVARLAADQPASRDKLCELRNSIGIYAADQLTEQYRMLELDDIIRWKFRSEP